MNLYVKRLMFQLSLVLFFLLTSCATQPQHAKDKHQLAYIADYDETIVRRHLPVFIIENSKENYNLIGTPSAKISGETKEEIYISTEKPSIYSEIRNFSTQNDSYTNLVYRIHFASVPFSLFPFHLGWGDNVGVIIVVTLNSDGMPVLYTIVQTCGCYLAFIPTSYMPQDAFPGDWHKERQMVYGESLPRLLDLKDVSFDQAMTLIFIKSGLHRIEDITVSNVDSLMDYKTEKALIKPLNSLQRLSLAGMGSTSFYENSGSRKGYVRGSSKPWERLLMSWWAFDWKVGEDKKLGRDKEEGPLFYTSLKPWARDESDMRDFPTFLKYWGWKL